MTFQSFLSWNWPLKTCGKAGRKLDNEFQSFLSWNWPLKYARKREPTKLHVVSILLIVELAFEVLWTHNRRTAHNVFQSFLSWNWPLKYYPPPRSHHPSPVSILLIVELAFEAPHCPIITKRLPVVSILLIVELAFEETRKKNTISRHRCFNPSYRGIGLWSLCELNPDYLPIKFQSFLSWNWPLKSISAQLRTLSQVVSILLIVELAFEGEMRVLGISPYWSFNPSYRGIGLWRPPNDFENVKRLQVSILLIVELAFEALAVLLSVPLFPGFQSFLSWNWPLKAAGTARTMLLYGFQSFLSWNWPLKIWWERQIQGGSTVSILLIVELAFEVLLSNWAVAAFLVSILLIVELAFEVSRRNGSHHYVDQFQSFLSWNWPLKSSFEQLGSSSFSGFNPSYRGIGLWRYTRSFDRSTVARVSILLIVELAFEDLLPAI